MSSSAKAQQCGDTSYQEILFWWFRVPAAGESILSGRAAGPSVVIGSISTVLGKCYLFDALGGEVAVDKIGVVGDCWLKKRVFVKQSPVLGQISLCSEFMDCCIFLGLSVSDEDNVLGLLHAQYCMQIILQKNKLVFFNRTQHIIEEFRILMSVTISNCNEICNAPTNQSTAKMLYSFPRQSRFLKRKTILCDKYYELKNTLSHRAAGLGYGHKYDFTKELPRSPPPNSYNARDEFSPSPKKGFSFGQSRDRMMMTGPLVSTISNKNPGPGNYEIKNTRSNINYSLSPKIEHQDKEKMGVPGPGQYPTPFTISKDGKYFTAKYKNSCVRDFGKVLGRCKTAQNKLPGPGAYDVAAHQDISPQGRYCLSRSQNCLARSFGSSHRSTVNLNKQTPGPGNYRIPSEFGYYASKNAVERREAAGKENMGETQTQ